jgi:hypothetical protein
MHIWSHHFRFFLHRSPFAVQKFSVNVLLRFEVRHLFINAFEFNFGFLSVFLTKLIGIRDGSLDVKNVVEFIFDGHFGFLDIIHEFGYALIASNEFFIVDS